MDQGLIQYIRQNPHLVFLDPENKKEYGLNSILLEDNLLHHSQRGLVFLYTDNSIDAVSIFFSFLQSPHVIALLSPRLNLHFKISLELLYQPVLIFDPSRQEIEGYSKQPISSYLSVFKNKIPAPQVLHPSLKLLLSTSGTTGSPKFVKLSGNNILQNALSIIDYLPIKPEDTTPLNLPVYYSYGLSILTTNAIKGGRIVCTQKDILNREFWAEMEQYGYSSLAGVPYVYEVLNRIGFTKKKYPSLHYMTQAGGKLNTSLVHIFAEYARNNNILFYVMYGQTEATARMSYLDPQYLDTKPGSIGKAIKNGAFYIDENLGELCYKGPNVFGGYATQQSDLEEFMENDVLQTGDIATVDDDGFYFITGRTKRFVKIAGSRINLDEIETLLRNFYPGKMFYTVGIGDQYILVVSDDKEVVADTVSGYLNAELGIHKSFVRMRYMESIPLTENGKINYARIQQYESESTI